MPDPDATVKVNRTVFLTINRATTPAINMPKLEGLSFRFAYDMLQKKSPSVRRYYLSPRFYERLSFRATIQWLQNYSRHKSSMGARITLIIGGGLEVQQMLVPDLVGLTFAEAKPYWKQKVLRLLQ